MEPERGTQGEVDQLVHHQTNASNLMGCRQGGKPLMVEFQTAETNEPGPAALQGLQGILWQLSQGEPCECPFVIDELIWVVCSGYRTNYFRSSQHFDFEPLTGSRKISMVHLMNKQRFKLASILLGLGLMVVIIMLLNFNSAVIHNGLVALDLLPKPEKVTELYFEDSAHLPTSATGSGTIRFTFVIHNLETTNYRYAYDVVIIANGGRHVVDIGNALVKNNQYFIKKEEIHLVNSPGRQDVVVELVNLRQSIDFWVENR